LPLPGLLNTQLGLLNTQLGQPSTQPGQPSIQSGQPNTQFGHSTSYDSPPSTGNIEQDVNSTAASQSNIPIDSIASQDSFGFGNLSHIGNVNGTQNGTQFDTRNDLHDDFPFDDLNATQDNLNLLGNDDLRSGRSADPFVPLVHNKPQMIEMEILRKHGWVSTIKYHNAMFPKCSVWDHELKVCLDNVLRVSR
jgi:hypothetical protein